MNTGGLIPNWGPNVYRTVTEGDLKAVSGMPVRCACFLSLTNTDATDQTAVFQGPDGVDVTVTLAPGASGVQFFGDFSALGTLGSGVTVVAGWIDDGVTGYPKNA